MRKFFSILKFALIPFFIAPVFMILWAIPVKEIFTQIPGEQKREMRAVWISTLMNIDWPNSTRIPLEEQKEHLIKQLNLHAANGMNAIIFQVRPAADAFYKSQYEPWSMWMTGKQGQAPQNNFDPLAFIIDECHKRNMELHAWFNPYRAVVDTAKMDQIDSLHISRRKPDWFIPYGRTLYFDPGNPQVREYVTKVIMDVVKRYDIDGVHFDDYFYPYKIGKEEFGDSGSFYKYRNGFAYNKRDDWRRNNTALLIKMVNDSLKEVKPWVKFGIAPFGVWRNIANDPRGSHTRAGYPCYDMLFADVRQWLQKGWIDYVAPQIYWYIGQDRADFKTILEWWTGNHFGRHLYIGHAAYKIDPDSRYRSWRDPNEMARQIRLTREHPEISGSFYFSSRSFFSNPNGINEKLRDTYYRTPALIPTMPWIDKEPPSPPQNINVKKTNKGFFVSWNNPKAQDELDKTNYWIIYRFKGKEAGSIDDSGNIYKIVRKPKLFIKSRHNFFSFFRTEFTYLITAVDRMHNESEPGKAFTLKLN